VLTETVGMSTPVKCGDLDKYCTVIDTGAISAGATASATNNVQRTEVTYDAVEIVGIQGRDGRLTYFGEVSAENQVQIKVGNPTAGSITPDPCVVRERIVPG
jgi:hypothetical protein